MMIIIIIIIMIIMIIMMMMMTIILLILTTAMFKEGKVSPLGGRCLSEDWSTCLGYDIQELQGTIYFLSCSSFAFP